MSSISRKILEDEEGPEFSKKLIRNQAEIPVNPKKRQKVKSPDDLISSLSPDSDGDILNEITDLAVVSTQEDRMDAGDQFDLVETTIAACRKYPVITSLHFENWYNDTYWFPFPEEELAEKISEIIAKHKLPLG